MFLYTLLFAFTVEGLEINYGPVKDISWLECNKEKVKIIHQVESYNLDYVYCSSQGNIQSDFVHQAIMSSSRETFEYINLLGLIPHIERTNSRLEIYELDTSTLNDHSRFYKWQNESNIGKNIWALYDPRSTERNVSSIVVTYHPGWSYILLAHEIAHYWFDRLSLGLSYSKTSEDFALNFENYLDKERFE